MATLNLVITELPLIGRTPLYEIFGNYYHGLTLTRIAEPIGNILYRIPLYIPTLISEPILVYIQNGWLLLVTEGNLIIEINSSSPGALFQPTEGMARLSIPDISRYRTETLPDIWYRTETLPNVLSRMEVPSFNLNIEEQIRSIVREHSPLYVTSWMRTKQLPMPGQLYENLNHLNIRANLPHSVVMPPEPRNETNWVRNPYPPGLETIQRPETRNIRANLPHPVVMPPEPRNETNWVRNPYPPGLETIQRPETRNISSPGLETIQRPETRNISSPGLETIQRPEIRNISLPEPETTQRNEIMGLSYETLMKQLYGIPIELPGYLIVNGIKANFVPFQQVTQMLQRNEIDSLILDPLLQPWSGPPGTQNRIITLFGKNGITYLAKVRYDQQSNQIYPPI
jgi:hypothetical protein